MNIKKLHSQISDCNPKFKLFFEYALGYLNEHNKELVINCSDTIKYEDDPGECTGWCDGDSIEIARESTLFEETFVHEFCHMTQAVENTYLWIENQKSTFWDDLQSCDINGIDFWNEIYKTILLERDCEARVLELNKEWQLFDNTLYAKQANAYLYFYHYVYITRQWELPSSLYCDELLNIMPTELCSPQQLKTIDMNIMNVYNKVLNQCI